MVEKAVRSPTIVRVALPTIIGNILATLVGLVSIRAVSILGEDAVAAVVSAERALLTLQTVFVVVTAATAAAVAQYWGAGRREDATQSLKLSITLALVVATALTLGTCLSAPIIIDLFGLAPNAARQASVYLVASSVFYFAFGVSHVMASGLRAVGDATNPLWVLGFANILNIGLLALLVHGFWIIPPLGVLGAAIANGVSYTVAAMLLLIPWLTEKFLISSRTGSCIDFHNTWTLLRIGGPACVQQLAINSSLFLMMFIVSFFGAGALAAYGIGVSLISFSYVFGQGFAIASATVVGQHLGAGDIEAARRSAWRATGYTVLCMSGFGALVYACGSDLADVLGLTPGVRGPLLVLLGILAMAQPLVAVEFALSGALRGAGDTRVAMLISLFGLVGGRIPTALIFYYLGFELAWVFGAVFVDYGLKALLYSLRLRSSAWTNSLITAKERVAPRTS